ncbi:MAG: hypothetical protein UHU21_08045 [Lachnospiraceae bacterium]|nr:hypothetical protein [Lachnospiraceae bacterium]
MSSSEPSKWTTALGASADVNVIPATTPAGTGLASMASIFPAITQVPIDSGGIAPERADFNALFKMLGDQSYFLQQGGVYSYSASYAYRAGDLVMYNGNLYRCIQAHAAGAAAPSNTAFWAAIASAGDIPTKTSQLQNDSGFVTSASVPTKTSQLQNDSGFVTSASVPTKTSQLQNDSGFITSSSLPAVNNGTLTIQQDGVTVGTFTANQSGNTTVNITGGGGGGGTLSGTILGGYVGSASDSPGIYSGTVGSEYNNYELFGSAFGSYPPGTKFECVVASSASLSSYYNKTPVYKNVTFGAFKLKSLGNGMIRYLFKGSAPSVGSTVTSDSDRYITDSNTVWAEDVNLEGPSVSTGNVVVMVKGGYVLPSGTSYVVDSILATYEHPGESGQPGWAGSPCYKCVVHAPS